MFLTTHVRAPGKWSYLLLALGFMMLGVTPWVLLTMHARVKSTLALDPQTTAAFTIEHDENNEVDPVCETAGAAG